MNEWKLAKKEKPTEEGLYLVYAPSADEDKPFKSTAWWDKLRQEWQLIPKVWADAITHWMVFPDLKEGRMTQDSEVDERCSELIKERERLRTKSEGYQKLKRDYQDRVDSEIDKYDTCLQRMDDINHILVDSGMIIFGPCSEEQENEVDTRFPKSRKLLRR